MSRKMYRNHVIVASAGVAGSVLLAGLYFGLVTLAESAQHALDQFQQQAIYMLPIVLGFGLQVALFTGLRWRLLLGQAEAGASGAATGAAGGTSASAMVACCAHHIPELLPVVGLTAATSFLAQYQKLFLGLGLLTTLAGNLYMLNLVRRARRGLAAAAPSLAPGVQSS